MCAALTVFTAAQIRASIADLPLPYRLWSKLFPTKDPGYIPIVGTPALRVLAPATAAPAIRPPPLALYAPPDRSKPAPTAPPPAPVPATPPQQPAEFGAPKQAPVRPQDLIPYFQLNDGSAGIGDALQFTPAMPSSQANFRQK
jgi:hypothetical protein